MDKSKRNTTIQKDNVIELKNPVVDADLLTEILRNGAHRLLAAAIESEVDEFLNNYNLTDGKARFVRNGYLPQRAIQTGIGDVIVEVPRVRDRAKAIDGPKFSSSIIPKYLQRSKNINDFLPLLYLKGISTNDFVEALTPLVGSGAKNLSPIESHLAKYPKAVECMQKDKEELLAFYDFPAEHWVHLRTSNPIESTFASVRHRTYKAKGAFSRKTILTMIFKLCGNAEKDWRRLRGFNYLADVIRGVKFVNGTRQEVESESVNERVAA